MFSQRTTKLILATLSCLPSCLLSQSLLSCLGWNNRPLEPIRYP